VDPGAGVAASTAGRAAVSGSLAGVGPAGVPGVCVTP
jgi:hypothetical protein